MNNCYALRSPAQSEAQHTQHSNVAPSMLLTLCCNCMCVWHLPTECTVHANSSSGEIFSRHFPAPYEHSENCVWNITPWSGHRLQITIHFLDILHSYKCRDDYLKFQHAHFPNQRRMCGHYHDITYVVDRATSLRFRSSEANTQHSGFRLSYKQVAVTGDLFVRVHGNDIPYKRRHWIQAG